jgi:nicotinate-nucleotide adenylyltransferase
LTSPSRIFAGLPPTGDGQAIGLLGGTFNPPHEGHRRISMLALTRLGLDRLWWMVTPGNPLKENGTLSPQGERARRAAQVAAHPRIVVSTAEQAFGTRYTADLVRILKSRLPAARFVWVMGSDNLEQFHLWEDWRGIAASLPIAVVNRPGHLAAALSSPAALSLSRARVSERDAAVLADCRPPAWTFINGPRSGASSTALRTHGAS